MTVLEEESPANYVQAAAVIRRGLAVSGFTGRKGCVGGLSSQECKATACFLSTSYPAYEFSRVEMFRLATFDGNYVHVKYVARECSSLHRLRIRGGVW
ncbi:hypothetical protein BGU20_18375 [Clostridioides difficile]|nr:hypothetical protein BGU20_18375 [Clostridioides difficile]